MEEVLLVAFSYLMSRCFKLTSAEVENDPPKHIAYHSLEGGGQQCVHMHDQRFSKHTLGRTQSFEQKTLLNRNLTWFCHQVLPPKATPSKIEFEMKSVKWPIFLKTGVHNVYLSAPTLELEGKKISKANESWLIVSRYQTDT